MSDANFELPKDVFDPEGFLRALKGSSSRIPLFKKNIERSTDYLHQQFRKGHYIRDLVWARARFFDDVLSCAWQLFDWQDDSISLIAVGGYGRGELHPHSDIDLLILLGKNNIEQQQDNISAFITLLWDMNLDIGHSVRTIDECRTEAAKDITIATNLMESRTIIGPVKFEGGFNVQAPGEIGQWQQGRFEVVAGKDKRTAAPLYPKPTW